MEKAFEQIQLDKLMEVYKEKEVDWKDRWIKEFYIKQKSVFL